MQTALRLYYALPRQREGEVTFVNRYSLPSKFDFPIPKHLVVPDQVLRGVLATKDVGIVWKSTDNVGGNATREADAAVSVAASDLCEECALDHLLRLDFSQVAYATREGDSHLRANQDT